MLDHRPVPVLGRRYRFASTPAQGGNDTLWKTGNPLTGRRHHCGFASTARYVFDMSDPDANWFVLLGGQDGWLGSTTLTLTLAGVERVYPIRGRDPRLLDFAEALSERVVACVMVLRR